MLPPLESGSVLRERYIIEDLVGQGGMGCVYLASDMRLPGRLCAVKEVQSDVHATPDATWPYIVLPDWAIVAAKLLSETNSIYMAFYPLITALGNPLKGISR